MEKETSITHETANSDLVAIRRSILGALNGAKKNCLSLKNTPHIESRDYALAHGKLEGINKAIDIVKKYCA
jgi:hypothetical protein